VAGRGVKPVSLGTLVNALGSDVVGHVPLASNLISKFNEVIIPEAPPSLPVYSRSAAAALDGELL